ncbi:iron-containing alcohol dehydrogenase family protein [Neobacillus niacini]|uniref:iron-containing alcohol dehydrogenase family protein n=1 Tax=Neobacillus niacini TaxID=86668 RepID=UPI00204243AC|nr:iron-containing alcohol dehydrogenase family protein [Neobacillus niacini]MCM3693206.1 iron-containing alcohol dehydrogenase family protein [Neobacillus niacini]
MQAFNLPLFLSIEENIFQNLKEKLDKQFDNIEKKKIMVFTSNGVYEKFNPEFENLQFQLDNLSIYFVEVSSYDVAVEVAKIISIEDFDIIIGIGGGKVLDTAKYAAYVSKKKYISIPTILSNDGIASPIAVLKTVKGRAKSFGCKIPDGILIDIGIIKNTPEFLLMSGIGDTVSNYSALFDWKLECKYKNILANDFAYLLSDTALNMLLYSRETNIRSKNFIRQLAQSLVLSGLAMDISGNSRPCSGSEHLFSHSLDEYFNIDAPHGLKVALGCLASCILQKRDYSIILEFLQRYNINVSPSQLGISKETFIDAWLKAQSTRPDRFSILNTINLTKGNLEEIYNELMEAIN